MAVDISTIFTPAKSFPTVGSLVNVLVRNAFVAAGVISFILLIFGGIGVIVAAGDSDTKKLEQGKNMIVGSVTGLVVVVASFWIVQLVEKITGIKILNP